MPKIKLYESYKWLYKKFIVERLTQQEIAEQAGTTQVTIQRWIKKHGLDRKKS